MFSRRDFLKECIDDHAQLIATMEAERTALIEQAAVHPEDKYFSEALRMNERALHLLKQALERLEHELKSIEGWREIE